MDLKVGVLALQGGVKEHISHLEKIEKVVAISVKKPDELESLSGLIIPGGESTTMRKLIREYNFKDPLIDFHKQKKIIWGTCAGLILLSREVEGEYKEQLSLLDIKVKRNAFGSQLNSFIIEDKIPKISENSLELVFIRAPLITEVGEDVEILYNNSGEIAAVESDYLIGTAFHPELTESSAFHQYFIDKIRNRFSNS